MRSMKRALVACAALALIAGCSSAPTPAAARPTGAALDAIFLNVVHSDAPGLDDATLLRVGHAICTDLDNYAATDGAQFVELAQLKALSEQGWTGDQVGTMQGAAITAYCPQYPTFGSKP